MEKYDLVELVKNDEGLLSKNISKGSKGVIINKNIDVCQIMFLNEKNQGEYAFAEAEEKELKFLYKIPSEALKELKDFISTVKFEEYQNFTIINIKEYDFVELLVEDEKYSKFGIHKGDTGCIMSEYAIQNYVEVDFSGIDKNGDYYGDCISVKIADLKVIK
jgi:hypothetical protein